MSDVTAILDHLSDGKMSLEEVAKAFSTRDWPLRPVTENKTVALDYARELEDPEVSPPGSFDDVASYYYQHKITDAQYAVLADVVADKLGKKKPPASPAG